MNLGPLRIFTRKSLARLVKKEKDESIHIANKTITGLLEENYHLRNLINADKGLQRMMRKRRKK